MSAGSGVTIRFSHWLPYQPGRYSVSAVALCVGRGTCLAVTRAQLCITVPLVVAEAKLGLGAGLHTIIAKESYMAIAAKHQSDGSVNGDDEPFAIRLADTLMQASARPVCSAGANAFTGSAPEPKLASTAFRSMTHTYAELREEEQLSAGLYLFGCNRQGTWYLCNQRHQMARYTHT